MKPALAVPSLQFVREPDVCGFGLAVGQEGVIAVTVITVVTTAGLFELQVVQVNGRVAVTDRCEIDDACVIVGR